MIKLILIFISLITFSVFAADTQEKELKDGTIASLIMGINSENFGLRTSAAFMLGELKCEAGVIPLMRMLKNEEREDARIVAALALLKIGDAKGIFAIKQAVKFDQSDRVKRLCTNFYNSFNEKFTVIEQIARK
ncbi:MAG: HEAT repeat domain-containing protein [Ignavibacteriaceae bacterium]|nr:HEAT repeat domain-containing protein [Ignavibacteriaceae bacterium]